MSSDILYIHQDGNASGSNISLHNLLTAFDRERFRPRILLGSDGPARQMYEALGIPVDVFPIHPYGAIPGTYWYQRTYYRNWLALLPNRALDGYLRRLRPDLVHINDQPMLQAGISCARVGLPVIWHLRGTYFVSRSHLQAAISKTIIQRVARRMIAISEDEAEPFDGLDRVRVIYNSLDMQAVEQALPRRAEVRTELGFGEDEIVIGMVGYLQETKGTWDFIRAAGIVRRGLPDARLRFVIVAPIPGREPRRLGLWESLGLVDVTHPEDKAWHLAKQVGIEDELILTGYRSDPLAMISAFDVMVSCFRLGAMGRPVFEAMAVGRPVVVTAGHSGRSQVVKDGETALVVPPGDLEALAGAVIKLASDPELRREMGGRGLAYSHEHFDPQRNARAVEQVYQEVLEDQAARKSGKRQ